jgi:DNA-directed RNA polymerase specialized sigma24 family protein
LIALQRIEQEGEAGGPAAEVRRQFKEMLAELPEPYSRVLEMVELEGISLVDAASLLVLREASIRLIYREGRRRLRDVVIRRSEAGLL